MVELQGFGVSCGVKFSQAACSDEFSGEEDREAKDFVEPRREEGIGVVGFASEPA